ncbi:hypothetical protein AK812_SmicGene6506 [Symbiodinium microadriaticum]|uniref:Uncharacterized protein n=1 Tax=Symbiodinium microadriaticum TaxID=2951 RepID=A0A1Q9ER28_SYMMI|nr:hypothetical protein AK812_SmicGene6506 [Symbiodinium microadriaticum]
MRHCCLLVRQAVVFLLSTRVQTASACEFIAGLSGATGESLKALHREACHSQPGHEYIEVRVAARGWASVEQRSPAYAGACVEQGGGCGEDAALKSHLDTIFADGCREGQPTLRHTWPQEGELGTPDGYAKWMDRAESVSLSRAEVISWPSLLECPAAACASLATQTMGAKGSKQTFLEIVGPDATNKEEAHSFIIDAARRMQFCYDELLSNEHQQRHFSLLGLIVAALEIALAHLRRWSHELRPRNPHHEEGRTVWHDHYSGLYPPVSYSEQFDLQWQLASEQPDSEFARERMSTLP